MRLLPKADPIDQFSTSMTGPPAVDTRATGADLFGSQLLARMVSIWIVVFSSIQGQHRWRNADGRSKLTQIPALPGRPGHGQRPGRVQGARLLCQARVSMKGLSHHQRTDQPAAPVCWPDGYASPLSAGGNGIHTAASVTSIDPRVA